MNDFYCHKKLYKIIVLFALLILFVGVETAVSEEEKIPVAEGKNQTSEALVPPKSSKDLELIDFANGLFQRNFYDMALSEYKKFIAQYPESEYLDDAYFGIAESLYSLKSYKKAVGAYNSYKEFFPQGEKNLITSLRLGQALFYLQDFDNALLNFNQVDVKGLDKDFVQTFYFYKGKTLARLKKVQKATAVLTKVIELAPGSEYAFLSLIELAELSNTLEDYIQAIEYYKKAFKQTKDPERKAIALYKQGEIYLVIKRHKEAIQVFQIVIKKYPDSSIAFDAFSNLLVSLYNLEKYEDVLAEYEKRQRDFQGRPADKVFKLYYILATAYVQLGKYIDALTVLDNALSLERLETKNIHKALIKKTEILVKIRKFDIALSIITDQLSESTEEKDNLLFLRAESFYGLEKYAEAFALYQQIDQDYPDSDLRDEAIYSMAHAKSKSGDAEAAATLFLNYFEKGKIFKKREEALYNLILIERELKDVKKTILYTEKFINEFQESSNHEKMLFLLGTLYQQNKEFAKAVNANKKFLEIYPNSDRLNEIYFLLAYDYQSLNNYEESLKFYAKLNVEGIPRNLRYPSLKNSALIYLNQENKKMAVKMFNEIVSLYADNDLQLDTYIWLAEYYFEMKEYQEMLSVIKKAEGKLSGQEEKKVYEVAFLRAQALRMNARISKAMEEYKSVINNEKDVLFKAASHIGLGLCYIEKKMYEQAKKEFETAILENTEDDTITMRARFEIANMYWDIKDYENAVKFYMFVSVLYDDEEYCPKSLFRAGQSFEFLEKSHEAIKVYDELMIRYPNSPYYDKASERIKILDAK